MTYQVNNKYFPDLNEFVLLRENNTVEKYYVKAGSSALSNTDFIETDFMYFQDKLEFGSPDILDELVEEDKDRIRGWEEKYLTTLFPTQVKEEDSPDDEIEYYSSKVKTDGTELICLLIPEGVSYILAFDSNHDYFEEDDPTLAAAITISFEEDEIQKSKVLYLVLSYDINNDLIKIININLSYEAYQGDKNPIRRMSDYVLRNDSLTENWNGYEEKDGFVYSKLSGSLIGTERVNSRPIYELMRDFDTIDNRWNRSKRYSIGDTARIGDIIFESVDVDNIGNHPYYSRMWVKKE